MITGPIIEGILLGLALAIMLGPALFALLQTSVHRGFRSGVLLASGIFMSDLTILVSIFFGISQLIYNSEYYFIFGFIGGGILIAFGIYTFTRKGYKESEMRELKIKTPAPITFILKGFILNFTNPGVWLLWMLWMATISSEYNKDKRSIIAFFLATLATVLTTDLIKCFIANRIKQKLQPKIMTIINHVVGVFLVIFGIVIIIRVSLS